MTEQDLSFTPEWVSPPGDTIVDAIEERDWTQAQLAERLGYTEKHVSLLINAKVPITEESAQKLSRVIGSTPEFWLRREAQYRAQLVQIEERERLQSWVPWLDRLPVKDLMKQGAIAKRRLDAKNKPEIVKELLQLFGVASPDNWETCYEQKQVAFRRTRKEQSNVGAISAWLRLGEIEAEKADVPKYNKAKFEKAVQEIRKLTVLSQAEFMPQMQQLCNEAGVILAIVPAISCAYTSGVARWLNPHRALIQLSLYGKQNDRFWFTFFHEAAHILLHDKKDIFLDDAGNGDRLESRQEDEANAWAREFLIPSEYDVELSTLRSREDVVGFAERLGIHAGIVVGRLQYEQVIEHNSKLNALKISLDLKNKNISLSKA
ncbi:ImmA/IrrE family metallo-endopeptidase [Pseudanabaena sp. ABRG5-3]|uniref:ImmA/IrrE family metallo-endopeptidase n=1 Tax=Pseudanabaena sp. ABRG5-3 TaxID=685565 RepID=UPI000DC73039|nr:ImmA/IrrE family metallo-endopeptidase [Pseudanabaena sp. ABRG5-3]BBC26395.1 plasmid maintenance system antidote protein, XRE family [Pseudanabaena sp. ABRG5-3]